MFIIFFVTSFHRSVIYMSMLIKYTLNVQITAHQLYLSKTLKSER